MNKELRTLDMARIRGILQGLSERRAPFSKLFRFALSYDHFTISLALEELQDLNYAVIHSMIHGTGRYKVFSENNKPIPMGLLNEDLSIMTKERKYGSTRFSLTEEGRAALRDIFTGKRELVRP